MADTRSPGTLRVPELKHDEVYRVQLADGRTVYRTRDELERAGTPVPKPATGSRNG